MPIYPEIGKKQKFALSDAIILAAAKKLSLKILTYDTGFAGQKEVIVLS